MNLKRIAVLLPLLPALVVLDPAFGQSNRYWNNTLSEEAFLLSGAVVAGNAGSGAIYYNPATISTSQQSRISLNSNIANLERYNLRNGLGDGLELKVTDITLQPSFFSLLIRNRKRPEFAFELAILTPEQSNLRIDDGRHGRTEVLSSLSGEEIYDARLVNNLDFSNNWVGFGLSWQLNERLSAGLSNFILMQSSNYHYSADINLFPANDTVTGADGRPVPFFTIATKQTTTYRFLIFQALWKAGLLYRRDSWSLGLNLTTPSLRILSDGKIAREISVSNLPDTTGSFTGNAIIVDQQSDLSTRYRTPFSVALGFQFAPKNKKTSYFLTAELFAGLQPYKVFDTQVNPDITTEEIFARLQNPDFLAQYRAAEALVNVAVGMEKKISPLTALYFGARTDFNYLEDYDFRELTPLQNFRALRFNVYHLTGGTSLQIANNFLVLGLQFSAGRKDGLAPLMDVGQPPDILPSPPDAEDRIMEVRYHALSFFLGFNFDLSRNRGEQPKNRLTD